eukprot:gnl/TRDRNA2_/TRDRNA2_133499_c0_seq1.p1 gnl/TRDRNA2_/TRDRNA2_133499_c0~~gnl/TRDRNA2_/TRDRNA2_133499_c0_seq1.p1  ORF type:complete len:293 (-),score=43.00 gnl/TRDRNA2_/TRDRNA2_133499_c0_seq1:202-1080(-)
MLDCTWSWNEFSVWFNALLGQMHILRHLFSSRTNCLARRKMASVICDCGKTAATFLTTKPSFSLECFCCDCSTRALKIKAALSKDQQQEDASAVKDSTPVLLQYFANKISITSDCRAEDGTTSPLIFTRMRTGSVSLNASAPCCGSLLFTEHPNYHSKIVMCSPDIQKFSENFERMPACGRCWIRDVPEEQFAAYEKEHPIAGGSFYRDHETGSLVSTGPFVPLMDEAKAAAEKLVQETAAAAEAKTFKELLDMAGGEVKNLNVPEPGRSAKLTVALKLEVADVRRSRFACC